MCRYLRFHEASWSEHLPLESERGDEREVLWTWLLGEGQVGGQAAAGVALSQKVCHQA